jgi:methionyl-tRNA synthetase
LSERNFDGRVPEPGALTTSDEALIDSIDKTLETAAGQIEGIELRAGLRSAMDAASEVNAYLNSEEPWHVIKEDTQRAATILWSAIQAISGIRVALTPYLPWTSARLGEMLGISSGVTSWARPEVAGGSRLGTVGTLFTKLEDDALDD